MSGMMLSEAAQAEVKRLGGVKALLEGPARYLKGQDGMSLSNSTRNFLSTKGYTEGSPLLLLKTSPGIE